LTAWPTASFNFFEAGPAVRCNVLSAGIILKVKKGLPVGRSFRLKNKIPLSYNVFAAIRAKTLRFLYKQSRKFGFQNPRKWLYRKSIPLPLQPGISSYCTS